MRSEENIGFKESSGQELSIFGFRGLIQDLYHFCQWLDGTQSYNSEVASSA